MNRKYYLDEIWKPVIGFEDRYLISNYGRMKNKDFRGRGETVLMNLHALKGHYIVVAMVKNGIKKQYRVHRLVAETFIGKPYDKNIVKHINGNKQDNRVSNLTWIGSLKGRTVSDYTRLCISYSLSNPSNKRRKKISEGQKKRFEKERKTHTGRYTKYGTHNDYVDI